MDVLIDCQLLKYTWAKSLMRTDSALGKGPTVRTAVCQGCKGSRPRLKDTCQLPAAGRSFFSHNTPEYIPVHDLRPEETGKDQPCGPPRCSCCQPPR